MTIWEETKQKIVSFPSLLFYCFPSLSFQPLPFWQTPFCLTLRVCYHQQVVIYLLIYLYCTSELNISTFVYLSQNIFSRIPLVLSMLQQIYIIVSYNWEIFYHILTQQLLYPLVYSWALMFFSHLNYYE